MRASLVPARPVRLTRKGKHGRLPTPGRHVSAATRESMADRTETPMARFVIGTGLQKVEEASRQSGTV